MTGLIRTAYASHAQPETAIRLCREQLGLEAPDLILAFVGGQHVPALVLAALQASFGNVQLTGGSAAGAISTAGFGYSGFEIGLMAFKGADVTPCVLTTDGLAESEVAAGRALGLAVRQRASEGAAVMLLFDSVASSVPLRLHPASQIMEGFQDGLGDRQLHVIGGGLLTDINLSDGWLFCKGEVRKHSVAALIFPPGLRASTAILHGCRPVSTFMEITRIDGAEVLELDHEPALTVVERLLGLELGTTSGQQLSLVATLGQKQGDPFAPYDENLYVNRLILQATPERGSITLFEPDFAVGTRVQIMSRDNALMLESAERGVAKLKGEIGAARCALALYIDCAGRASIMSGAETEEAETVLRTLAPDFPFMGFYSGVEIAPFAGHYSRPLDWTGVLMILQHDA
ncbi:FIST signal transduction protein [Acidocella sp.]|uniref:FIST signal transduction protein n=1 Tax=Acidocella sp. TaxID=50710 RepID=UPI002F40EB0D